MFMEPSLSRKYYNLVFKVAPIIRHPFYKEKYVSSFANFSHIIIMDSHVKSYGMCRPNGLVFHQKSLDMGPILVKKILRRGFYFKKIVKSAVFETEKPLEMGPDLRKVLKISSFLREKNP